MRESEIQYETLSALYDRMVTMQYDVAAKFNMDENDEYLTGMTHAAIVVRMWRDEAKSRLDGA